MLRSPIASRTDANDPNRTLAALNRRIVKLFPLTEPG